MGEWLRRAGSGLDADGARVTWSVAEGRRGRRWREVVATDAGIRSSLLLELDPDGRFSHLELSTPAGLLTLHPEGDGTLHGNTVTASGIEHVRGWPWGPDGIVQVEGSTVALAAALPLLSTATEPGRRPGLEIRLDLQLAPMHWERTPTTEAEYLAADPGPLASMELPQLVGGTTWELEESD